MVRNFFPQAIQSNIATNTNYPPQSSEDVPFVPGQGIMEYQDLVQMQYEAGGPHGGELMEYET